MPTYRKSDDSMSDKPKPCIPRKLIQYPLINPDEVITDLDPKQLADFPSQAIYPAPRGETDEVNGCGCLMTYWPNASSDRVGLETIWQPLWVMVDSVKAKQQQSKTTGGYEWLAEERFGLWRYRAADGQAYDEAWEQLVWPKRYHVWEIEVTFKTEQVLELDGQPTFCIGEKNHLNIPLQSMFRRPTRPQSLVAPLPIPLYLPPVQNFCGMIEWRNLPDDYRYRSLGPIRFQLNGYLHREIP